MAKNKTKRYAYAFDISGDGKGQHIRYKKVKKNHPILKKKLKMYNRFTQKHEIYTYAKGK